MLKEEIGIYQDKKNDKTTIVIRHMSYKTREALAKYLLGDLSAVEEVTGLEEVGHDMSHVAPETNGMEPVVNAADVYSDTISQPQTAVTSVSDEELNACASYMQTLWQEYNELQPDPLMEKFVNLTFHGSSAAEKYAASIECGNLLKLVSKNRRVFQRVFWGLKDLPVFSEVMMKLLRQKGAGDGLAIQTDDYNKCVYNVLSVGSDEELVALAEGCAKHLIEYSKK